MHQEIYKYTQCNMFAGGLHKILCLVYWICQLWKALCYKLPFFWRFVKFPFLFLSFVLLFLFSC